MVISSSRLARGCQSFAGSSDDLGVLLTKSVVMTSTTIKHASPDLVPQLDVVPKDIIVWALIKDGDCYNTAP